MQCKGWLTGCVSKKTTVFTIPQTVAYYHILLYRVLHNYTVLLNLSNHTMYLYVIIVLCICISVCVNIIVFFILYGEIAHYAMEGRCFWSLFGNKRLGFKDYPGKINLAFMAIIMCVITFHMFVLLILQNKSNQIKSNQIKS